MAGLSQGRSVYLESEDFEQLGYEMLDDGDFAEALEAMDEGLRQHPGDEDLCKLRILLLILIGELNKAEKELQPYLNDGTPATIRLKFCLDVRQKKAAEAMPQLYEALKAKALNADEFFCTLEDVFNELPAELLGTYLPQIADEILSEDALSIARCAAVLMDCDRHAIAVPLLEKAIDIDAYDIFSWQDLARCQFTLQNNEKCLESCEMGLAIEPENPLLSFLAGYCLVEQQKYPEAIPHLEVMRQYVESGKRREGAHLDEQEEKNNAQATYDLLRECYQQACHNALDCGNINKALEWIERAIECAPQDETMRMMHITMLIEMKRYDEAFTALDNLISIIPTVRANLLLAKAELGLQCKRNELADKAFRQLLDLKPMDVTSREMMTAYFESIGDKEALKRIHDI